MKVYILSENTACSGFCAEHGLSVYIEHNDRRILLDAGSSDVFLKNAEVLGIDLSIVDTAILSHAHYDHAEGFKFFFEINAGAPVIMQAACRAQCYAEKPEGMKDIGICDEVRNIPSPRLQFISGDHNLGDCIYLLSHTTPNLDKRGKAMKMYIKSYNSFVLDDFSHEQTLVIRSDNGLCIFSSCSHGGPANILNEVHEYFPSERIYAYVGGFHLMGADGITSLGKMAYEADIIAQTFIEYNVDKIYSGHCTGIPGFELMKEKLGNRLIALTAGSMIEL